MENLSINELEKTASSYQELMVPSLFESWADQVLNEAQIKTGSKILDVACGTGVLALAAKRLNPNGYVVGLDINPGMLSVAKKLDPDIEWREGAAEDLPWEDQFFDTVVSQFGLMFFEDKQAALREMNRVLKPGGRMVIAVFDALDYIPGYNIMTNIFGETVGEEVAQALRFPFSLGDREKLKFLCSESGLAQAQITRREWKASFPDVWTMVLADIKGWFPLAGIELNDKQIDEILSKAKSGLDEFVTSDGTLEFPMPAYFISSIKN